MTQTAYNHEARKPLVLCCGSRSWRNWLKIKKTLHCLYFALGPYQVLHGGADGADAISGAAANLLGFSVEVMRPNWLKHGKRAGMLRNTQMLDRHPDYVVAFWDGSSRGTLDTISKAVEVYHIPTMVVTI